MEHVFTLRIYEILKRGLGDAALEIYRQSPLLQYLNLKMRSVERNSKSRSSFGNLYAIYVLVEDYIRVVFKEKKDYSKYEGANFKTIFRRQRELPFGAKLQNHALNHRMNEEFRKFFPNTDFDHPIMRDTQKQKYWINENLLKITIGTENYNIARQVIEIIDEYVKAKKENFEEFIKMCKQYQLEAKDDLSKHDTVKYEQFLIDLLSPKSDARIFEIISYSILKYFYRDKKVYFGFERSNIQQENLTLYKTGRTNANDGGIDFVMRPLGRFFQVTETLDVHKYFLDIDKVEKFPITFVIKSTETVDELRNRLELGAKKRYSIEQIVQNYMSCIEEIINIPILLNHLKDCIKLQYLNEILEEIVQLSMVEFNYPIYPSDPSFIEEDSINDENYNSDD